jgi:carboxyl-terminal processing protease
MKQQIRLIACSMLLLSPAVSLAGKKPAPQPQVSPTKITPDAAAFLDNALDTMRQHALHGQSVDWTAVRTEAFKRAGGAFNPIDTYPAIYWALVQLGDPGAHLRLPPGLYPDQIALLQQAERDAVNNAPAAAREQTSIPTPFTSRRLPEGHIVTVQGRNFGYVVLPRCSAKDNDGQLLYAADVRRILTDLTAQSPKGWIVDLRGNTGGNMWPMLAGIGPILGDGSVGSFVANDGNVSWFYQDGKTGTRNPAGLETVSLTLQEEPVLQSPSVAPVAVLVDSSTASSAEAITIAFHGRPASRSFGSRTAGKSTAVQPFKLDDGAELYVTTAIDADRSGKAYPDGFTPDQVVSFNGGSMPQESNDQVLQSAQTWLVASTTTVAPAPAATLKTKTRRKKAGVPQNLASTPAPVQQPSSAPAVAAVQTPSSAPAPAPVEAPATAPAAAVAEAPIPAAVTPVAAPAATFAQAPVEAPAAAVAQTPVSAPPAAVAQTPVSAPPAAVAQTPVSAPPAAVAQAPAPAAPAAAVAQTPNSADVVTPIQAIAAPPAPITPPPPTAAPAIVASTTPAAPSAPPAPKPKVQRKKVVVHEGS